MTIIIMKLIETNMVSIEENAYENMKSSRECKQTITVLKQEDEKQKQNDHCVIRGVDTHG